MSSEDPIGLAIGLLVGNLVWLLGTLILSTVYGISALELLSGPFSGAAMTLLSAWVIIGGILGVADVLAVLAFISSLGSGR